MHGEEFMPEATEKPSHANRRQFMQMAGAGVALAGLTGCRRPAEQILPYTRKPQDVIEGVAQYYATAMPFRGTAYPVLAKSHVGRPTKLEGNPDHPYGVGGGSSAVVQAAILGLYDPDRSRRIVAPSGADATWQGFVAAVSSLSGPLAVLAEPSSSPTVARLRTALAARFPGLRWVTYRPEGDGGFAEASRAAYGRVLRPLYDFAQADVIVSFDADFLGGADVNQAANARSFAQSRRPENDRMSRFYAVESTYTVTGGQADHRLRLKPSQVAAFAQALSARLGAGGAASGTMDDRATRFFDALVADLAGKRAVFVAGETMPAAVHALALALTARSGGMGTALRLVDANETEAEPQATAFANLVRDIKAGQVPALLLLGVNPAYDAPASYGFADALKAVRTSIHVGQHRDETGALATWHLPRTHFLEAWGDARAYDGTLSVVQPLIAPLNDTETAENRRVERDDLHSEIEILNVLANRTNVSGYELVRETWRGQITGDFETGWTQVVHDGFVPGTAYAVVTTGAPASIPAMPAAPKGGVEIAFRLDPKMVDGSIANNGWLIEFPDNVTKLVWDNVATISRATAERLGLSVEYETGRFSADVIELDVDGRKARLPLWILPGHADDTITVNLGWGRQIASTRPKRDTWFFNTDEKTDMYGQGPIANGVGVNVAPLRDASFAGWAGGNLQKVEGGYTLVSTQEHGDLTDTSGLAERLIVAEGTHDEYKATPNFVHHLVPHVPGGGSWETEEGLWGAARAPRNQDFYKDSPYARNQWGTVVDLTTCTGCSACVIACNAENNIQTVGKKQVGMGRELHWLRLDRYFVGEEAEPRMVQQYLTCVHCENAPCESVCPVAATYHSPDGTNQMIYNRCIGTRYCSNNCPYKVRRYNWFNWTKTLPLTLQMQQNPDVTVRFRGVMEKCSLCVQRIREANDRVNLEGNRAIKDGEVQTACQQACPTDAITFGDLNDPSSAVVAAKKNPRRYELLPELGTRPRLSYLARIRNPNPALEPPVAHGAAHGSEHAEAGHGGDGASHAATTDSAAASH